MKSRDPHFRNVFPGDADLLFAAEQAYSQMLPTTSQFEVAVAADDQARSETVSPDSASSSTWGLVFDRMGVYLNDGGVDLEQEAGMARVHVVPNLGAAAVLLTPPYDITDSIPVGRSQTMSRWATSFVRFGAVDSNRDPFAQMNDPDRTYGLLMTPFAQSPDTIPSVPFPPRLIARSLVTHLLVPDMSPDAPFTAFQLRDESDSNAASGARFEELPPDLNASLIKSETGRYMRSLARRRDNQRTID